MEQLEIIIPGGQKLSVRDFVEWEYNGGKADFQPDEHYPLWGTVPIEDKLRYIAISVFGDLASYGKYDNRIGVTDGESEHYFFQLGKFEGFLRQWLAGDVASSAVKAKLSEPPEKTETK